MNALRASNLHFEESGKWRRLPGWAEYFISIGRQLAEEDHSTSRIVTAIVVPTRAFCAAFVSLGLVLGDAAKRHQLPSANHFEKLTALPLGTPVVYRKDGKILKGVLQGADVVNGRRQVRVQVQSKNARTGGGLSYWVDEARSTQVQPAKHTGRLPKKQTATNKRFANKFVDDVLGEGDPVQLGLMSKLVCAVVGKRNALEYELRRTQLAVGAGGKRQVVGQLQDLLRVDRFVSAKQSHRSALIPDGPQPPADEVTGDVEVAVVFDGATGLLKWGHMWPDRHQVIVLDRTEPRFEEGVASVNSRYSQNRADGKLFMSFDGAPAGSEIIAFREEIA